jgi:hypothetical protein
MKASTSLNHSSSIWRGANSKMGILSKGKELDVNKDWGGSNRSHRHGSGKTGMSTSAPPRSNSTSSSSTWTRGRTRYTGEKGAESLCPFTTASRADGGEKRGRPDGRLLLTIRTGTHYTRTSLFLRTVPDRVSDHFTHPHGNWTVHKTSPSVLGSRNAPPRTSAAHSG